MLPSSAQLIKRRGFNGRPRPYPVETPPAYAGSAPSSSFSPRSKAQGEHLFGAFGADRILLHHPPRPQGHEDKNEINTSCMSPNKPAGQQTHDFGPRRFRWGPAGHFKPVGESVRQPLRRLASRYFLRLKPGSQPKDKFLCIDPPGNFPRVFDAAHLLADLPEIEQQAPILLSLIHI